MLTESMFFFNDTATTEIYTLSLHDALPIFTEFKLYGFTLLKALRLLHIFSENDAVFGEFTLFKISGNSADREGIDRKSTRLNSSHANISYAVFCLKKKPTSLTSSSSSSHRH